MGNIEEAPKMHWSKENLKDALEKLWEMKDPPVFGPRDGKYYVMGFEVEKPEYDYFENEVNKILELGDKTIHEGLDKAA